MFKNNIKEIIKIKNNISNISAKKIEEIYKVLNKPKKDKFKLNITTKGSLRRQVIIPISLNNSQKFILLSKKYVFNIDRALKDIKSDTMVNFIYTNNRELIVTTNKVVLTLNLNTIEKYIKNINKIDSENILLPRLS